MGEEVVFSEEQQTLVNKLVGEARVKARDIAQQEFEDKLSAEKEKAEQARLAKAEEWQELAEQREGRIIELEQQQSMFDRYQKVIENLLEENLKAWGEAARKAHDALPESMSPVEKLEWLMANAELFSAKGDGVGTPGRTKQTPSSTVKGDDASACRYSPKL